MSEKTTTPPPAPPPYPTADLATLLTLCARPLALDVQVRGQPLRITGRRLSQREVETLREILAGPLPAPGADKPDLADPAYRARVRAADAQARAYALFAAYPLFGEQAPADVKRDDPAALAAWLEASPLEASLLDLLYEAVTVDAVQVPRDRVLFA